MRAGFRGWHERGYLPHRDEPGLTQFVTFHLADSLPASLRARMTELSGVEKDRNQLRRIEQLLDAGAGECHLRRRDVAEVVEGNFLLFAKRNGAPPATDPRLLQQVSQPVCFYELRAWVLMPNHVHVLFKATAAPMSKIVADWKKHTGRRANKLMGRRGSFWARDYYDTYMRDAEHEKRTIHYIENNPTRAKLVLNPSDWPWSSARFRDINGVLRI